MFRGAMELWVVHETKHQTMIHMTGCGEYRLGREPREGWGAPTLTYAAARAQAELTDKKVLDCNRVLRRQGKPIHGAI